MSSLCVKFNEDRVHALYPEASMVPAMKIWSLPKNKRGNLEEYCGNGKYLASLKLDGFFYMLNRTPQYSYLFSRAAGVNGLLTEKIGNVPHIREASLNLPPDTLLVGEIYVPGGESKDVTRIMGCKPEKAIQRQESEGYLHYNLNDIVMFDGEDVRGKPFEERLLILESVFGNYLSDSPYISVAENISEDIFETAMSYLEQGEEGMVLKRKDFIYDCDKRPAWSSIKIKSDETIDAAITGFCNPTKEYKGNSIDSWEYWVMEQNTGVKLNGEDFWTEKERWIGKHKAIRSPEFRTIPVTKAYYYGWKNAIEISAYDKEENLIKIGTISSGLTDELRRAFADNPEDYLNKVVEVECMSVNPVDKTLRHGFFKRFRDDKNAKDCKISEIFK